MTAPAPAPAAAAATAPPVGSPGGFGMVLRATASESPAFWAAPPTVPARSPIPDARSPSEPSRPEARSAACPLQFSCSVPCCDLSESACERISEPCRCHSAATVLTSPTSAFSHSIWYSCWCV